jgi:hypothetical protein
VLGDNILATMKLLDMQHLHLRVLLKAARLYLAYFCHAEEGTDRNHVLYNRPIDQHLFDSSYYACYIDAKLIPAVYSFCLRPFEQNVSLDL